MYTVLIAFLCAKIIPDARLRRENIRGVNLRYTYDGTRRVRQLALGCESN